MQIRFYHIAVVVSLLFSIFLFSSGDTMAGTSGQNVKSVLGIDMQPYTTPDKSLSLYVPRGWTAQTSDSSLIFVENEQDPTSARIEFMIAGQQAGQQLNSEQVILTLANQMKTSNPSFEVQGAQRLAQNPDVSAVLFTYNEGSVKVSGFGMAQCTQQFILWTDIYGKDSGFKNYNPVLVLIYVLQSMNQGTQPSQPQLPQQQQVAVANQKAKNEKTNKKMEEAMFMNHYWNMYPYMYPEGFYPAF